MSARNKSTSESEKEVDSIIKNFGVQPSDKFKSGLREFFEREKENFLRLAKIRNEHSTNKSFQTKPDSEATE
jgi:hypothetical protein